jgi:hypothetical protein
VTVCGRMEAAAAAAAAAAAPSTAAQQDAPAAAAAADAAADAAATAPEGVLGARAPACYRPRAHDTLPPLPPPPPLFGIQARLRRSPRLGGSCLHSGMTARGVSGVVVGHLPTTCRKACARAVYRSCPA